MVGRARNPLIKEAFQVWYTKNYLEYLHLQTHIVIYHEFTLQACQDSFSIHPKLVKKLKDFYVSADPDRFFEDFIFFMKLPLSGVTERSPFIDRTLGT